jgi:sulfofructose kinase
VGTDAAGQAYLDDLKAEGVDTTAVRVVEGAPTAVASILVDPAGERLVIPYCRCS